MYLRISKLRTLQSRSVELRRNELGLFLGNRLAATIKTEGIFGTRSSQRACLAYIQLENIAFLRDHKAKAVLRNCNKAYIAAMKKKYIDQKRLVQPRKEVEDPYIIAIFLAMVQEQRAMGYFTGDEGWKVHLIALPKTFASEMYFYSATIPKSFLRGLDNPRVGGLFERGFTVSYELIDLMKPREAACLLYEALRNNALCE
ncbi:hypothetical protein QQS21_003259 [Conoideocrella luteorostrata]|uniref:Uncharacterized protein n=1 Tax=Conoideocrella luteorostrata TaxID=1105319 RepID=A0AAJ0CWM9_9HYPO|nr:hypothetical protein QQS21_003259 [Conoideocrella luteorostrata]